LCDQSGRCVLLGNVIFPLPENKKAIIKIKQEGKVIKKIKCTGLDWMIIEIDFDSNEFCSNNNQSIRDYQNKNFQILCARKSIRNTTVGVWFWIKLELRRDRRRRQGSCWKEIFLRKYQITVMSSSEIY